MRGLGPALVGALVIIHCLQPRVSRPPVIMYPEIIVTAIVALVAGLAPLYIKLDLHLVSCVAAGIIISTAFVIVIPEGIEVAENEIIGYPLLIGFMLMYCMESALKLRTPKAQHVAVNQLELEDHHEPNLKVGNWTISFTSVAMILHSLADGLSFGAACLLPDAKVRLSVLFAVLVHKAPAAFSFASILLSQRVPQTDIKRDVVLFSLAAPLAALIVYYSVSNAQHFMWWAGQGLLFSGGSFLFISMHVMPQLESGADMIAVVAGITLPLVASMFKD